MNFRNALSVDSPRPAANRPLAIFGITMLLAVAVTVPLGDARADGRMHALLDVLACSWALCAGALAMVRHYALRCRLALFTGIGFLGASALDGWHVIAASLPLSSTHHAGLQALAEWNWVAPRAFLAAFLALGASSLYPTPGRSQERALFFFGELLFLACLLPFFLPPLPWIQAAGTRLPIELLPGVVFLFAFSALLRRGKWRTDSLERSLLLTTFLGSFDSLLSPSVSLVRYDVAFALAHFVKNAGYLVVFPALVTEILHVFRHSEQRDEDARKRTAVLDAEVAESAREEEELRRLGESLEERVRERTLDLEASRVEAMQALDVARRAKFAAQAAERRFRDVLEWALDPMIIADARGTITMANHAAEELFGYSQHELVGQPIEFLVPEGVRSAHAGHRASFMAMPAVRRMGAGIETAARRKDGSLVPIEVSLNPIESPGGTLVSSVIQDLTEKKKAEAEIARYTRELERSNAELEQFAYVASHDLQEPLRMVSSFTQLLARRYRGKLDATADQYIGYAVDGARRMHDLIRDLLKYSRVGTKEKPLEPVACDEVLSVVLGNLRFTIEESMASVTRETLPVVDADATQLAQVFQNLIANAIKFRSTDAPRVHIKAVAKDGQWVFSVRDNGIGIEPEHLEPAFEIFTRFHHREECPGTGIGLAICKRIVERHGGKMWLESRPGQGTVAYFSLPQTTQECRELLRSGFTASRAGT